MIEVEKGSVYVMKNGLLTSKVGKMSFGMLDIFFYTPMGYDKVLIAGSSETPDGFRIKEIFEPRKMVKYKAGDQFILKSGKVTSKLYKNDKPITRFAYPFFCHIDDKPSYLPDYGIGVEYPSRSCKVTNNIEKCHKEVIKLLPSIAFIKNGPESKKIMLPYGFDSHRDIIAKGAFSKGIQKGNLSFISNPTAYPMILDIIRGLGDKYSNGTWNEESPASKESLNSKAHRLGFFGKTEPETPKESYLRRFPSGAVRSDDRGRIRPDYISPYAMEAISKHFTGAEKDFGSNEDSTNYFKGIPVTEILPSLQRHTLDIHKELINGANLDTLEKEFSAIASNAIMALHTIALQKRGDYKEVYGKKEYITQSEHDKTK